MVLTTKYEKGWLRPLFSTPCVISSKGFDWLHHDKYGKVWCTNDQSMSINVYERYDISDAMLWTHILLCDDIAKLCV